MSEIVVRTAVPADAGGMARVHVTSWRETYRGYFPDEVLDAADFIERRERMWTTVLNDERYAAHRVAVAELTRDDAHADEGEIVEIVGIAMSGPGEDADAPAPRQLSVLYLLAAQQGGGAGQRLLDAVLDAQATSLWVADPNPRAQAFYRRNGFEFDGTVGAEQPRELRMIRAAR